MATAKFASVTNTKRFNDSCQLVHAKLAADTDFNYEVVNISSSTLRLNFQMVSQRNELTQFLEQSDRDLTLAALTLGDGPGSNFMNQLK